MEKQELRKAVRHVESEALEQARRRDELRRWRADLHRADHGQSG